MPDTVRERLRHALAGKYHVLKERLTRKLGSSSLASEALHETWLDLGKGSGLNEVLDEDAYLYRSALNMASALRKRAHFREGNVVPLSGAGRDTAADAPDADIADESPGPDQQAFSRMEFNMLLNALEELPERQKGAFLGSFMSSTPPEALAAQYGVSLRTIQADIRDAVFHCARRLNRKDILGEGRSRISRK